VGVGALLFCCLWFSAVYHYYFPLCMDDCGTVYDDRVYHGVCRIARFLHLLSSSVAVYFSCVLPDRVFTVRAAATPTGSACNIVSLVPRGARSAIPSPFSSSARPHWAGLVGLLSFCVLGEMICRGRRLRLLSAFEQINYFSGRTSTRTAEYGRHLLLDARRAAFVDALFIACCSPRVYLCLTGERTLSPALRYLLTCIHRAIKA